MTAYWDYTFKDTPAFIETFDELPLWSAPFGLLLLKHIDMKRGQTVLDIGSGAGFPLLELAERLGPSCSCIGIDPWKHATNRTKNKIQHYQVKNVDVIEGSAEHIPLENNSVDLIVSNLGINNFDRPESVIRECHRVLKMGSKLVLTSNLNGHWKEFYDIFENCLRKLDQIELTKKLMEHQEHRGSIATISKLIMQHDFKIHKVVEETFQMRFLSGTSFLNHHFVKVGWLSGWKDLIPEKEWEIVFKKLETELNAYALEQSGLSLTVPMAYIEGLKS
jgi:ubiquinone/menaquinone biosynthesis C-methylase UbiE